MELKIKETRGAQRKYEFSDMIVGSAKEFTNTSTGSLLNCAKRYALINGLHWKFRCYSENNHTVIVRVK